MTFKNGDVCMQMPINIHGRNLRIQRVQNRNVNPRNPNMDTIPHRARLDAPGTLHHVMVRGIERRRIVNDVADRKKFVERLGELAAGTKKV
jgi:hypothetical protein